MTFLLVTVLLIVAPGPDFALTVRNSLTRRSGFATALGVVSGQLLWALAAVGGVVALLVASRPAFEVIRLLGACYLIWLGLSTLLSRNERARLPRPGSPYRQGLVSNLANPKMAIFFASLLPQFGASLTALTAHSLVFAALTLLWLALVARASAALRVPAVRRALDVFTAIVLVAFGARLAVGRR